MIVGDDVHDRMHVYASKKEAINVGKTEIKRAQGQGCSVCCCYLALSPIGTLHVNLLLLGEQRDVVFYCPNGIYSKSKEEEEDDDDDRDGDVALNHLEWRRSADRGREVNDLTRCVESFDRC